MDSSARPSPAGLSPQGNTQAAGTPAREESPVEPTPLAKLLQDLPKEPAPSPVPLREKAVAEGSRSDVKSSSLARSDLPAPASRPGLLQIADLGAQAGQTAKASGHHTTSPSTWFVALGVLSALPCLYRVGEDLRGASLREPPRRDDEQAMVRQAVASLALDRSAPLPPGGEMVDRLVDLAVPPGAEQDAVATALYGRLERAEHHLTALAMQADDPLDMHSPSRRFLARLDALDQEVRSLLADAGAGLPAALRTELARLVERITAERGFAQQAEAFAKAHDTGNLNFEGIMAYMRHGTTAQQLHFLLFEQAVAAAYRASYVKGTPVAIPPGVADSYQDLWQKAALRDTPPAGTASTQTPSTLSSSTMSSSSTKSTPGAPPGLPLPPSTQVDEPGYREYDPGADRPE